MPIVKVPQKHKFGIVSLNKVEGLLSLTRQQENASQRTCYPPLLQINQDFVTKYNSKPENARESMDTEIKKALQHAKYRAGVGLSSTPTPKSPPTKGAVLDVTPYDTSIAWLELALLCQCNGPLQEEVLQTLGASLNMSPLSTAHVPSLVYVAGLCYQWLKNDALSTDVLRTGELLLLKILFYISLRLYYHHLTECLMETCTSDEIRQLKYDIEGFENKEKTYRYLPEALLNWKIALEVGLTVCENYSKSVHDFSVQSCSSSGDTMDPQKLKSASARSSVASHGGGSISSILWHSLDIWQCTRQRCEVLQEALQDLLACSTDFCSAKWLEGVLAMNILCTTSQVNLDTLNLLQSLAMGHIPTDKQKPSKGKKKHEPSSFQTTKKASRRSPELPTSAAKRLAKGTRFTLPSKKDYSTISDNTLPPSFFKSSRVATLNVLGMQPDFNVGDADSVYTVDQTVLSYQTKEGGGGGRYGVGRKITKSADDVKFVQGRFPRLLPRQPMELTDYMTSFNSNIASSVDTQSLIANESIPDTLPSAEVSNVTMLDLGSITTLDPVESLEKSMGLFACSTSKNFDTFMSHLLVSPGLCELTSREDILTSAIPELSGENSIASDPEVANASPNHRPCQVSASTVQHTDSPGLEYDRKKAAEVNWESKEHVLDDKNSVQETAPLAHTDEEEDIVQPQYVKMVTTAEQYSRPDTRCSHYTHSTAPLADGANMLGSQVHPSTVLRQSMLSSSESSCKAPPKKLPPFERWPSEVALTYTLCMGSISIYGKTSAIQRTALLGPKVASTTTNTVAGKRRNYGLLGLAGFETEDVNDTEAFSCWSVRHGAILGLSRVHKTCRSIPMKDGLSDMAFEKLTERQRVETDTKASHAFTIAQVGPDLDEAMVNGENLPLFSPLLAHIADGLSDLFLPSPPSYYMTKSSEKQKQGANLGVPNKKPALGEVQSRVKTSMMTKQALATPSFNTRTFAALEKITKEHWRRQMLEEERQMLEGERQREMEPPIPEERKS